jgi:sporulation protein YlmC with PRC-barrel domain
MKNCELELLNGTNGIGLKTSEGKTIYNLSTNSFKRKTLYAQHTFIISVNETQGYMVGKNIIDSQGKEIGQVYKFALPFGINSKSDCWLGTTHQPMNGCCESVNAVFIGTDDDQLWISPIHKVKKLNNRTKDLEMILSLDNYKLIARFNDASQLPPNEEVYFRGFVNNFKKGRFSSTRIDILENSKQQEMAIYVDEIRHSSAIKKKEVQEIVAEVKLSVAELFYSQKTKDTIGGFDL